MWNNGCELMMRHSYLTKCFCTDLACILRIDFTLLLSRFCQHLIVYLPFCSPQVFHCVHFECPAQSGTHKDEGCKEVATTEVGTGEQQLVSRPVRAASTSSLHSPPGSTLRSHAHQP